jgi:two-component system response regulator PhoP
MRILIIEDESHLREQIAQRLRSDGYAVDVAANGVDGLHLGRECDFDAAIVDLGLPDMDGTQVIEKLRAAQRRFPILVLTARGRWEDKVAGLETGADDYLTKPFHIEELTARVRALVRRAAGHAQSVLNFDPIVLNLSAQEVRISNHPVELTAFEYKALEYLMLHAGKVISKAQLTEHLYAQDYDRDSNVIEVFIGRLRRKLDPENQLNPIETLRGQGYRFRAPDPSA